MSKGQVADVLVVGGGIAGLCAAIAARRRGARVRLLESAPLALRGGDARHARNFRFPHDEPTGFTPGRYTVEAFLDELRQVAGAESALARPVVEAAEELPGWLEACGVRLQGREEGLLPYSRRTAFLYGGGKTAMNALYRTAAEAGVGIDYETPVKRIWRDGAEWRAETEAKPLAARAVVVANGGPGGDPQFLRAQLGPAAEALMVRGGAYADGRLMRSLVDELGVETVGDPASLHMVAVDARGPRVDGGIVTRVTAIPYGLVVDREGRPLLDAGRNAARTHYAQWGTRIAAAPGGIAYLILDAAGLARADPLALAPQRTDSLAALLELDEAALPKELPAPPLYVVPLRAGVTFAHFGLEVDQDLRLIGRKDGPFEGLYAAGMIVAANILPRGYLAGFGLTLSAVTGRRAGEAAAAHALA